MSGTTCLVCGRACDGRLRVAVWEEEEKGRLAAKSVALCADCHAAFLAGTLSRVEVANRFHERAGYRPAEWIARIDRDALLDISCLSCGILLPVAETPVAPVRCPRCGATNLFAERLGPAGRTRLTAALETAPA
jgi:phage FluMu protein Com